LITVPSRSSVVIISYENVPTEVPTFVIQPVTTPYKTTIVVPDTWVSPYILPATLVKNVPATQLITLYSKPGFVVI
jgi:hypothetical protein